MFWIDHERHKPLKLFHGVVCGGQECPGCGADLTAKESLEVIFGLEHASFGLLSRVVPVGQTGGCLVEDVCRLVACGYESMLRCNRCGENLSEHEHVFTWKEPEEHRLRLEEAASRGEEDDEMEDGEETA